MKLADPCRRHVEQAGESADADERRELGFDGAERQTILFQEVEDDAALEEQPAPRFAFGFVGGARCIHSAQYPTESRAWSGV